MRAQLHGLRALRYRCVGKQKGGRGLRTPFSFVGWAGVSVLDCSCLFSYFHISITCMIWYTIGVLIDLLTGEKRGGTIIKKLGVEKLSTGW